jgi:hypothetical protein
MTCRSNTDSPWGLSGWRVGMAHRRGQLVGRAHPTALAGLRAPGIGDAAHRDGTELARPFRLPTGPFLLHHEAAVHAGAGPRQQRGLAGGALRQGLRAGDAGGGDQARPRAGGTAHGLADRLIGDLHPLGAMGAKDLLWHGRFSEGWPFPRMIPAGLHSGKVLPDDCRGEGTFRSLSLLVAGRKQRTGAAAPAALREGLFSADAATA